MKFQSPRSGKFVSDMAVIGSICYKAINAFQSPRSGKFVSDVNLIMNDELLDALFQSPRSGEFVSD